jgi:hypothetical protein
MLIRNSPLATINGMIINKISANFHPYTNPMTMAPSKVTIEEITAGKRVKT